MTARQGGWIQTATGRAFWVTDPHPDDVDAVDIAHGLAAEARYNGQTPAGPYSVAQHSVLVSLRVEELAREGVSQLDPDVLRALCLTALLHDAAEAYVKDIPRPLKRDLPGYEVIEERVLRAVFARFDLAVWLPMPSIIRRADDEVLASESVILHPMETRPRPWGLRAAPLHHWPLEGLCRPWGFETARREWLKRFDEVGGEERAYAYTAWGREAFSAAR